MVRINHGIIRQMARAYYAENPEQEGLCAECGEEIDTDDDSLCSECRRDDYEAACDFAMDCARDDRDEAMFRGEE